MSSGINIDGFVSNIGDKASAGAQEVADLANGDFDVTSPADMVKMQLAMMHMNMAFQLQASMVKSVEDMLKAIVQRM